MGKRSVLAGLGAQRHATLEALRRIDEATWIKPTTRSVTLAELAEWIASVDEAAAVGRFAALTSRPPGDVSPGAELSAVLHRLERAGTRLRRRARGLPAPLWRARLDAGDGVRRSLAALLRLRVLREWLVMIDPALAPSARPAPAVGRVLARSTLERLPLEVLPRSDIRVGVLRLVLVEVPGEPIERSWGIDFARKHYGPRVVAEPDAVVRTWSGALARLLEGEVEWSELGTDELEIHGDEALAAAWLSALPAGQSR